MEKTIKKGKHITDSDKARFLEIMRNHVNVLECKKHNTNAIKKKRTAWESIVEEYNAEALAKKTEAQLKILWKDLKAKAIKAVSKQKRETFKTGGGKVEVEVDNTIKLVADLIPQVFQSLTNVNDDDMEYEGLGEKSGEEGGADEGGMMEKDDSELSSPREGSSQGNSDHLRVPEVSIYSCSFENQ